MSPDARGRRPRRRGWRIAGWTLSGVVVALVLFIGLAFPWGPIDGLRVERADLVAGPPPERRKDPSDTPRKVAVTFSVPHDLEKIREGKGANFIRASLAACIKADVDQTIDIAHDGDSYRDPRLQLLPPVGEGKARRYRYRVTFDDWLAIQQGHIAEFVSAIDVGGGPCFSLTGGSMFMGRLWSDRIPLHLAQPKEASPAG